MHLRLRRLLLVALCVLVLLVGGLAILSQQGTPVSVAASDPPELARPAGVRVVAEVNGVAIYPEQLVRMYTIDTTLAQWVGAAEPQMDELVERAVHMELVSQAARQNGYVFPEETLTATLATLLLSNDRTRDEFDRVLSTYDISPDVFLTYYRRLLLVDAFSRQQAELSGQGAAAYIADLRQGAEIVTFSENLPDLPTPVVPLLTASSETAPTSTALPPTPPPTPSPTLASSATPSVTAATQALEDRGTAVGMPAPDFSLATLEGEPLGWSDLLGAPTLLSFWVTWCSHCRAQTPRLIDAYAHFPDVQFVGISVNETYDAVQRYAESQSLPYPVALDRDGAVGALYGVRGFPTTFFLDHEGRVVASHVGELSPSDIDAYLGGALDSD